MDSSVGRDLVAHIRDVLSTAPNNGAYPTIAIDGRGASGKTTLAPRLSLLRSGGAVVHGDDYFEPHDDVVTWGEFNERRFDADVLSRIRAGDRRLALRPYDFARRGIDVVPDTDVGAFVIVERCFAFALNVEWDLRIWVDTPRDVCLDRGLARDEPVFGKRAVLAWTSIWQPREDAYIRAFRPAAIADVVVS